MAYTVVDKGSKYFNTVLYTGNGSTQSIGGLSFAPDWLWIKGRSGARNHSLFDIVRGNDKRLISNSTGAETTETAVTSFNSDGFTLDSGTTANANGETFVSWCWDANGAGVSNTNGSITSTVSANTTSGFSIGTYTGNGTAGATIGHGLNSDKVTIIIKRRDTTSNWAVKHYKIPATQWLQLDQTDGANTASVIWNNTEPDVDKFTVGSYIGTNASGGTYVFYAFAEIKGYSKFGKYTGNGSTDGTFTYTGFKPAFVLIKPSSIVGDWYLFDNKRIGYNDFNAQLYPNLSNAEAQDNKIDLFSNGFKIRSTGTSVNGSGTTYIYMCFAESPIVSSKGIPTTAR